MANDESDPFETKNSEDKDIVENMANLFVKANSFWKT